VAFSDSTKDEAFKKSGGQCQCRREECPEKHYVRCPTSVTRYEARYHHIVAVAAGGNDGMSNCAVLCIPCYLGLQAEGPKKGVKTSATAVDKGLAAAGGTASTGVRCRRCNRANDADANFCKYCGVSLVE